MLDLDKELEVNKPVTEEETNEFLKLMKHGDYCIMDQLKKTPAKISIMLLILNSEPHRNALQKVLNETYVPQDIEQKTMEYLVGRIRTANYLYFTEDELDAEGMGHNKPLYVTVRCKDCLIGKVLIDNGSALNMLPRHMLDEMLIDPSYMQPSVMTARVYNGSPRQVIRTIEVELAMGPQVLKSKSIRFIYKGRLKSLGPSVATRPKVIGYEVVARPKLGFGHLTQVCWAWWGCNTQRTRACASITLKQLGSNAPFQS